MLCKIRLSEKKMDLRELYEEFYESLSDSTGTVLIHHGKAKYPGKYTEDYKWINLFVKDSEALELLQEKGEELFKKYNLNKLMFVHQIGKISKNDTILFLGVEAKDRNTAFEGVRQMLEYVKMEHLIGLEEVP